MQNTKQTGFTLVELIVVIVILGILAATALPKFIDFTDDAEQAAIKGVAGALTSASTINYGGCAIKNNTVTDGKCVQVNSCADAGGLLEPAVTLGTACSATAYYIAADTAALSNAKAVACELRKGKDNACAAYWTAPYTVIGAAN